MRRGKPSHLTLSWSSRATFCQRRMSSPIMALVYLPLLHRRPTTTCNKLPWIIPPHLIWHVRILDAFANPSLCWHEKVPLVPNDRGRRHLAMANSVTGEFRPCRRVLTPGFSSNKDPRIQGLRRVEKPPKNTPRQEGMKINMAAAQRSGYDMPDPGLVVRTITNAEVDLDSVQRNQHIIFRKR